MGKRTENDLFRAMWERAIHVMLNRNPKSRTLNQQALPAAGVDLQGEARGGRPVPRDVGAGHG